MDLGLFSEAEARAIRAEGERVIGRLDGLIPTGWERWRPDQAGRRCHCRSAGTAEDPTLPPRPSDASCFRATRNAVLAALAWRLGHPPIGHVGFRSRELQRDGLARRLHGNRYGIEAGSVSVSIHP